MTTLQRRLLFFLVSGLALLALLWLLDWSWKGLIVLLVVLLVFLGAYIKPIYTLVVHPPHQHAPEYQQRQSQPEEEKEEEWHPYQEGYQPEEHPLYFPSGQLKEEPVSEEPMMTRYPEQVQ